MGTWGQVQLIGQKAQWGSSGECEAGREWAALGRLSTCFSLDKQEAREARAGGGRWLRLGGRKPAGPRGCQGSASPLCLHVATTWELLKNALA